MTHMSDSNWGWIESINPSGTKQLKLSRGRYERRLGSFWDGRVQRESRPVYDQHGELIVKSANPRIVRSKGRRKSHVKVVVTKQHEFKPRFAEPAIGADLILDGDRRLW